MKLLVQGILEETEVFLAKNEQAQVYLEQVAELLYGFETPYGLEQLSTVGWILQEEPQKSTDKKFVVQSVQNWNERKTRIFSIEHIEKVWEYLVEDVHFVSKIFYKISGTSNKTACRRENLRQAFFVKEAIKLRLMDNTFNKIISMSSYALAPLVDSQPSYVCRGFVH